MRRIWILVSLLALSVSGCSSVKFYSDSGLKTRTGVRVYSSRPYLLVSRTNAKDNPITVQVVYLPDLESPQFARYRGGFGSSQFNFELTNSILTKYGQTIDTKIPETLTSIGSLLGSAAGAFKTVQEGQQLRAEAANRAELDQLATTIAAIERERQAAADALSADGVQVPQVANNVSGEVKRIMATLSSPEAVTPEKQQEIATSISNVIAAWDGMKVAETGDKIDGKKAYNAKLDELKNRLQKALDQLKSQQAGSGSSASTQPVFELYEIRQSGGKTTLVPVIVPAAGAVP